MNPFKPGDTAICMFNDGWKSIPSGKKPEVGQYYIVSEIDGNYISLCGLDPIEMWHIRNFEKPKTVTQLLAQTLLESIVEERPEYERVFTLSAKF